MNVVAMDRPVLLCPAASPVPGVPARHGSSALKADGQGPNSASNRLVARR